MRFLASACLIAFAVGLGVTVAYRMHSEAMAVVVGVLCGVSASIPVSLLVLYAVRQSQRQAGPTSLSPTAPPPKPAQAHPQPQAPQIIVVAPGMPQGQTFPWGYPGLPGPQGQPAPTRGPRDFTVIGDDD
ncbi:MAG: hypothetical protein KIT87_11830 [Anaerolineae bacterium]|nr:hypothetical protein [Anaerolineae bacterium]